ncbi:hypothetical protein B0A54_12264 [Friedmanniomyces endolithicus]|uniref:Uncharacterized protein n=1 Tax=Friedmanniomyces endolithicus TaxID=329885 RepID=A0A4V5N784_9PEZI|nr:hypothetical protein B0A54_12264 [Friedmanniomyces endolithicus]
MASTMITLIAVLAVSSIAAAVPGKFSLRSLAERASSADVELYVYVSLACTYTSVSFSSLEVPFLVKSAESIAYPAGYDCQVDFNNKCGDTQGTYDEGLDHCQTANQYFGGVYILCIKD